MLHNLLVPIPEATSSFCHRGFLGCKENLNMSIQELTAIVSPPDKPLEVSSPDIVENVKAKFGIAFPNDLYDICSTYGSGWFMGIQIYNLFSLAYCDLVEQGLQCFRELKETEGDSAIPYSLYPNRPGLFPCGEEENGGHLFWLVDGTPESWPLVLFGSIFEWERHQLSISTFLAKSFKKELSCIWWDRDWQEEEFSTIWFRPEPMHPEQKES